MFCPTCGRSDSQERRFCPACGTNLERVNRALSPREDGILTRADKALERIVARYAGLFFKDAQNKALDRRVSHSWLIFGEGLVTMFFTLLLLPIFTFILPIRFLALFISTPVRMFSQWINQTTSPPVAQLEIKRVELPAPPPEQQLMNPMPSATEHTTMSLASSVSSERTTHSKS